MTIDIKVIYFYYRCGDFKYPLFEMVIVMQNSKLVKTNWKKLFIIAEQYEEVKEKSYKVAPSIHCRKAAT